MKTEAQENLMNRYLLGDLPEAEASILEERCFTDQETFEQMWEVENRLVDRYIRGGLSHADRERFEGHYLASPVHRHRVSVARKLLSAADAMTASAIADQDRISWWERLTELLRGSPFPLKFAMGAVALLLVLGVIKFFNDRARLQSEIVRLQTENSSSQAREKELAAQIAAEQLERTKLSAQIDELRKRQTGPPPSPSPGRLTILSFLLSPINVRAGEGQKITIPSVVDRVQLQLNVNPGEQRQYQASINQVGGSQVWRQRTVNLSGGQAIVNVPANRLPLGDYILTLFALNSSGHLEEINRYSFRVIRE